MVSAGSTGIEEPPGITALSLRPPFTPPARASRSANGVPRRISKLPGFSTWPETEKIFAYRVYRTSVTDLDRFQGTILQSRNIAIDAVGRLR